MLLILKQNKSKQSNQNKHKLNSFLLTCILSQILPSFVFPWQPVSFERVVYTQPFHLPNISIHFSKPAVCWRTLARSIVLCLDIFQPSPNLTLHGIGHVSSLSLWHSSLVWAPWNSTLFHFRGSLWANYRVFLFIPALILFPISQLSMLGIHLEHLTVLLTTSRTFPFGHLSCTSLKKNFLFGWAWGIQNFLSQGSNVCHSSDKVESLTARPPVNT